MGGGSSDGDVSEAVGECTHEYAGIASIHRAQSRRHESAAHVQHGKSTESERPLPYPLAAPIEATAAAIKPNPKSKKARLHQAGLHCWLGD